MRAYTGRDGLTMANEAQQNEAQQGIFLRGGFLGREASRTWTPEPGRTVTIRPKIGLMVDGEEIAIDAADEPHMAEVTAGWVKGDVVTVRAEPRPPFNGKGGIRWFLPGVVETVDRDRWK
jgi:hypothetical protein